MTEETPTVNRRTATKLLGLSGLASIGGYAGTAQADTNATQQPKGQQAEQQSTDEDTQMQMFERIPAIGLPVIDGYHDGEKVWFIHTSASSEKMAERLTEMVNYRTLHVPKLDDIVDRDELADIYVFRNGVDQSDVEPWGGGPFGFQIDIIDSVPGEEEYTPLRHPHLVMWKDDAEPEILESVDALMEAKEAGRLTIKPTDIVVTAPVVSWPGDPFGGNLHMGMGPSESMEQMMGQMSEMMEQMCEENGGMDQSNQS
jgi:hypothetical protein